MDYFKPSRDFVRDLKVGDNAPDCFGRWSPVVEIFGYGDDINGRAYVCYYVAFGPNGTISHSLKEGEIDGANQEES